MAYLSDQRPLKLGDLSRMAAQGEKITALTAYDSSFAALLERCGVEVLTHLSELIAALRRPSP